MIRFWVIKKPKNETLTLNYKPDRSEHGAQRNKADSGKKIAMKYKRSFSKRDKNFAIEFSLTYMELPIETLEFQL